jgi:P4 family phage/plasmid primase-like protien
LKNWETSQAPNNIPRTNSVNYYTNNNTNNVNNGDNGREQTKESQNNDQKITNLLKKITHYGKGDPVDLYLKSRNIKKYCPALKIYTDTYNKVNILVNEIKDPKKNDRIVGINEIFLTKDGKKKVDGIIPTKIHRIYSFEKNNNNNFTQPVRLPFRGKEEDRKGIKDFIYVTEGIENGLSLQEHIDNEVWCSLSIQNFIRLPYEKNKRYIFVFDNDDKPKKNNNNQNNNLRNNNQNNNQNNNNQNNGDKPKEDVSYSIIENNNIENNNISKEETEEEESENYNYNYTEPKQTPLEIVMGKLRAYKGIKKFEKKKKSPPMEEYTENNEDDDDEDDENYQNEHKKPTKNKKANNNTSNNNNPYPDKFYFFYLKPEKPGQDVNDLLREIIPKEEQPNFKGCKDKLEYFLKTHTPIHLQTPSVEDTGKPYGTPDPTGLELEFSEIPANDEGIAERFLRRYGHLVKIVDKHKPFVYKDGFYEESDQHFHGLMVKAIKMLYYERHFIVNKERKSIFRSTWKVKGYGDIKASKGSDVSTKLRAEIMAKLDDFDADDDAINFKNGWYNFKTKELNPHSCDKLFRKKVDVEYNPELDYKNSQWSKFLNSSIEDEGKRRYIQKAMGYTFCASERMAKIFILTGKTRSGKSVLLESVANVFDSYSDKGESDMLEKNERNNNNIKDKIAQLRDKRFLHISELDNSPISSKILKNFVGDRKISAAEKFKSSDTFFLKIKLWIATNEIRFDKFDESLSGKIVVIDFPNRFYDDGTAEALKTGRVGDPDLSKKLDTDFEKQCILKWVMDGYDLFKKEGLQMTDSMKDDLKDMMAENDDIGFFLSETLTQKPDDKKDVACNVDLKTIHEDYCQYEMKSNNVPEENLPKFNNFCRNLRSRGFKIKRRHVSKLTWSRFIMGYEYAKKNPEDYYSSEPQDVNNNNSGSSSGGGGSDDGGGGYNGGDSSHSNVPTSVVPVSEEDNYIPF